ncbi:MAG TPA: hypothetical protein GXX60_03765 [Anaerolineaceae bacterium]|nr:hypothetical protein [Anaerolineaceae bacterium]
MSYDDVISFNPRLHAGGDLQPFSLFRPIFYCFNPRLHAGGDWRYVELHRYQSLVSIHASTREATLLSAFLLMSLACFNPRLHAGGDLPDDWQINVSDLLFQSTPPRGRRPTEARWTYSRYLRFNPRLHAGGDLAIPSASCASLSCFNPRLHAGGDLRWDSLLGVLRLFQSTPPRGRRHAENCAAKIALSVFQSTPPRGRRRDNKPVFYRFCDVSIHASTREATLRWLARWLMC